MEAVPPRNYPRNLGTPVQPYPFGNEGPKGAKNFFPPVCLKYHWDPTVILRHTLPTQDVALPMDPRPWTRICMEYTTAGGQEAAPPVAQNVVLPSGGQFYPPTRYMAAIDNESKLRRLDRPLGICETSQYEPNPRGDMFNPRLVIPDRKQPDSRFVSELSFPQALLRAGPYPCREEADMENLSRSGKLFYNATKQDKYNQPFPTKKLNQKTPELA
jgi:hypothetical protein